jgi:hypothetical protein
VTWDSCSWMVTGTAESSEAQKSGVDLGKFSRLGGQRVSHQSRYYVGWNRKKEEHLVELDRLEGVASQ